MALLSLWQQAQQGLVGLALAVRIHEEYGSIEEDEIQAQDEEDARNA
jgi:hypothetical protein